LQTDTGGRKCHVLLIFRRMIPSVLLCGHSQLLSMAEMDAVEYRAVPDMKLRAEDINWADTVFLGRLDNWYERRIATLLRSSGRRLVYIIDDDLLNLPSGISSAAYLNQPEIQDNIRAMIDMSHAILSPSPLLLEKYAVDGRKPMQTQEPALEPVPYAPHDANAPVKIGFAGSIDRTADIEELLRDALLKVKHRYGNRVTFEFFGAVPAFASELDALCIPYTESYAAYRRRLNALEWDIGLAPMPETPFHSCKYYNKFCEYAAAGIAGIYTDCRPYSFIPDGKRMGRFCGNKSQEWYEQICAEIDDRSGREAHRRLSSEYATDALNPHRIAEGLFNDNPDVFSPVRSKSDIACHMTWLKLRNVMRQVVEKSRRYGVKLPVVILQKARARLH